MKLFCLSFAVVVAALAVNAHVLPFGDGELFPGHPPPFIGSLEHHHGPIGPLHPHSGIPIKPASTELEKEKEEEQQHHHEDHKEPSKEELKPREEDEGDEAENELWESPAFERKSLTKKLKCKAKKACCKSGIGKCCKKYKKKCCKKGKRNKICRKPDEPEYPAKRTTPEPEYPEDDYDPEEKPSRPEYPGYKGGEGPEYPGGKGGGDEDDEDE